MAAGATAAGAAPERQAGFAHCKMQGGAGGAYVAGTGVNAVIPARGGDVVRLFLAKRRIEGSTYTTLVSTSLLQTLFDMLVASCFIVWAVTQHVLPGLDALRSPSLPALDYGWAFRHPVAGLILVGLLLIFGTALV